MKNYLKRTTTFFLALLMLVSVPLQAFAEVGERKINYDENPISDSGFKEGYINKKDIDVKVAKPKDGSQKFIEGPDIPDIYTMRAEYRIQRGDSKINNYQPYEVSVGASIKEEDKEKIKQTINLPDFDGYTTPTPSFDVNYKSIVNKATKEGEKISKKEGTKTWTEHKGILPYKYNGKKNSLKVKHIFQSLEDKDKYGPIDGKTEIKETTERGLTGSIVTISPLEKEEIQGFEPENSVIETQMPENTENYVVEYRYNRKHFDVHYDTKDGTPIPTRTIYYGQRIPTIPLVDKKGKITTDKSADPTYKLGSEFLGWKPSVDLKTKDGKTYEKDKIIKDSSDKPVKTLDLDFVMPAGDVTFTAEWKDKPKADYAIQFWAEKADHADGASLLEKYEYMGTRVHKNVDTGFIPNLDEEPVDKIVFPDLDQARLQKIWNGEKFYGDQYLYLNKFFVYNKVLTHDENKDPKNQSVIKSVSSTGQTVYNIYYDRQVYDLYFTKSNVLPAENTFYPEIYVPDGNGGAKLAGGPGNPYHYQARFNELMLGWPNDAMQTKGFDEGKQSYGWGPNYGVPNWPLHLDTPPYRLNADEFLDMPNYDNWGGYVSKIDKGDGTYVDVNNDPRYKDEPYKALSFGIKQEDGSMPHHMDFWMDGFKPGETIIRYDLYRSKADTNSLTYGHKYSKVQGFIPYGSTIEEGSEEHGRITEDDIDALNEERGEITPYPNKNYTDTFGFNNAVGQMVYKHAFFNNADPFGDPLGGDDAAFKTNGYIRFKYKRNKYPLRFNYDPQKTKGDNEFDGTNSIETFYEFPLKVLSPDLVDGNLDRDDKEYFKEDPKNLIDNPENLNTLGLTDLVFNDPKDDNKLKVKRPDNLPDQMVFKGWALDPAGQKMVWDNPKETMPSHAVNLYAKWAEPDFKWKVTLDPNGGSLSPIKAEDLTKSKKTIQEGDIGQEEKKTYPEKKPNDGKKQIFTVIQRQQLNELKEPKRWGYDFLGWEWVKFNADGTEDKTYFNDYKVPELYSFGNDVVSDVYLRAIWVKNDLQTVMAYHHILDKDLKEVPGSPESQELPKRRKGHFAAALGSKQGVEYTLVPKAQWEDLKQKNKTFEDYYNEETGRTNNYFQVHEIKGPVEEVQEDGTIKEVNNKENDFHFFYMPYRKREYKVNYLDERCKKDVEEFIAEAKKNFETNYEAIKNDSNKTEDQKREAYRNLIKTNDDYLESIVSKYSIIDAETVINGKRHYDARNYRHIPGWTLAENESPQQQLFFDVDENTNEFLGINGTGLGEIFFFYQDARVIEVKNPEGKVPDGYVRVTFKVDDERKGGVFKDKDNNEATEIYYDVIKGLKSDSLPVPGELGTKADGSPNDKEERKYYITPDNGKSFVKWDNKPLLNKGTILQSAPNDYYVFTAYFDWSGLSASGLVRTEAFTDPNGKWTNNFAPTIEDLKKQLVWKEREQVKPIPAGTDIKFFNSDGNELKTNEDIFKLVNEQNKADKDELVRTVNIKAKVTFKDGKEPQELDIPITVYKNVYEALNKEGDKPLFLKEAEGKKAEEGGLKDVTGNYVKVTVQPTEKNTNKDAKVYYVNPKAWVVIPEVEWSEADKDKYDFLKWTADKKDQNENKEENGVFDFGKRHKFTDEKTTIKPLFTGDVVEQKEGEDKPKVPDNFVKVIVKTTDKATTELTQTFWVNPTKEVTIPVKDPTGKEKQKVTIEGLGEKEVNYIFKEWQKVKAGEADDKLTEERPALKIDLAKNQYTDKVTVIEASYFERFAATPIVNPIKTEELHTPEGKEITDKDLIDRITPPVNKEIESIIVVERPDPTKPGKQEAKVIVKYKDGSTQGTNDNPVVIPVEVHKNIIPEAPGGKKPSDALDNYVKVTFTAGEGGKFENTLTNQFVYYVSPEVEVDLTSNADAITKIPEVGYISGNWDTSDTKKLKDTFKTDTVFTFNFTKNVNVIEVNPDNPNQVIPKGYVKVTFKTEDEAKGKVNGVAQKIYYVNPKAEIKLVVLADGQNATDKQLAVPTTKPNANYVFQGWQEEIDETTPITSERVHVAIFKSGQVTLTYVKGGDDVTGDSPKIVTVNVGTTVRLAGPGKLAKKDAKFAGWKIGETTYQAGEEVTLDVSKTAVAQWTNDKNIIPYNPSEPITRPVGYVRVTFEADPGLKLTEEKAYYVKANKGITLGNTELVKPAYKEETGYKFKEWDKEDSLVIEATDIVVTANATKLDNVIPEKDGEGNPNTKPEGYKEVTFVVKTGDEAKGAITGVAKFYVNPTEYVTINPPATKPNTGFEFGTWDKDAKIPTVYDKDTTITGSFNGLKDVIPKTNPDGTENKKPDGYKTVTFVIDPATGGKIADKEVTIYYVNPAKDVTVPQPKTQAETGYEFEKWDQDTTAAKKYDKDITVKGNFKKLDDIIPSTDGNGNKNAKPEGYVTLTFDKGDHGKEIKGQTVYYVNPKANPAKTLANITKPTVTPETGWKVDGWDKKDTESITGDLTVTAQYKEIDDVIPKTTNDESEKPAGYITVTFVKGDHGKELTGQAVYYVNPNKAVVLKDKDPKAVPNTGYKFARWDVSIDQAIQYKDGAKITALYNEPGNISTTEVDGYVKVEFKPGTNGSLTGTTNYWIKPGVEVNIPAPSVKPNVGYKFDKWDKSLTVTAKANDPTYEITAQYNTLEDIIPQKNTDGPDRPAGYHTITFKVVNGTTSGQTVFYVNGEKSVDLTNTASGISKKANVGYTDESVNWTPAITNKKYTSDETYTFTFKPLDDVIEEKTGTTKPDGYVTVKLIPTDKATDETKAEKVYFVNPKAENVTIKNKPEGKKETINSVEYTYVFNGWKVTKGTVASWTDENINGKFTQDTEITAEYSRKAGIGDLIPAPVPKKDVVTPVKEEPKPEDLIENKTGLPDGTTFKYTDDGKPSVDKKGNVTAKVEVKYPNGKTVVVEVPITVVDNVVPQERKDKPLVPDTYVKVTVDTTDKATDNTYFEKIFWVKPNEEVWIPVNNPTGKEALENGVKKTNRFVKWVSDDDNKEYANTIKDTFTKDTKITATYEQDKNVEPKAKDNQWIPQGSSPSPKDFINNPYNDSDPNNKDNLPPGTKLEFVPGTEPNTTEPGTNKTTSIKITYPNGEVKEVPVTYNVTGDVVEQPDPNDPTTKPAVPDNFVKVIVKTTEKATEEVTRLFWVNPEKVVTIKVSEPTGKEVRKPDGTIECTWEFTGWDDNLTQQFKDKETIIKAKYVVKGPQVVPQPNAKYVITDVDVQPTKDMYLEKITPPLGKEIGDIEIVDKPDVSKRGVSFATIKVIYKDGTSVTVRIDVIVQDKNMPPTPEPGYPDGPDYPSYPGGPIPMYPEVRYETIIQEKIVKVPVPVADGYFKEVRYMQGFSGYFRPNDGLTRAEAAQILANALVEDGYKYNPNFKISYKDVGEAWYTRAVKIVTEANVFAGYDDGNFKPQAKITRNEWIATLKRFQELGDASGNNMKLRDDHWAKAEIQAAFNEGWLKIYTDGLATYKGDEFIPRQEVAAVSNKAFKRIVDKAYIGKNNLGLITYKDVNTSMWAYEDILCASNTFLDRKDRYIAHWYKEDKNQFNIDTSSFDMVQKNFQRNPR